MSAPQGVLVVWEWEWQDDDTDVVHISESFAKDIGHCQQNPHIQSDPESETDFLLPSQLMHNMKCIGTTHDFNSQAVLRNVNTLLGPGEVVLNRTTCMTPRQ